MQGIWPRFILPFCKINCINRSTISSLTNENLTQKVKIPPSINLGSFSGSNHLYSHHFDGVCHWLFSRQRDTHSHNKTCRIVLWSVICLTWTVLITLLLSATFFPSPFSVQYKIILKKPRGTVWVSSGLFILILNGSQNNHKPAPTAALASPRNLFKRPSLVSDSSESGSGVQ